MRTPGVERGTRLVGVALLVMAGFSTGLRHAHSGGHQHDHGIAGSRCVDGSFASWASAPLHMHVSLLGFQFTLPADESDDSDSEPRGDHPVLVRLIDDDLSDSATRAPLDEAPASMGEFSSAVVIQRVPRDQSRTSDTHGWPLCDSARHERSGVLRA